MTRNSADRTKALIMQVLWALMFFLRMKTKPVSRKHAAPALRTAFTVANAWGVPGADRSGRAYSTMSTMANTATERTAITQRAAGDSAANVLTTGEGTRLVTDPQRPSWMPYSICAWFPTVTPCSANHPWATSNAYIAGAALALESVTSGSSCWISTIT